MSNFCNDPPPTGLTMTTTMSGVGSPITRRGSSAQRIQARRTPQGHCLILISFHMPWKIRAQDDSMCDGLVSGERVGETMASWAPPSDSLACPAQNALVTGLTLPCAGGRASCASLAAGNSLLNVELPTPGSSSHPRWRQLPCSI